MNKKFLFFPLKFIVSAALIWFIISNFELGSAVDRFDNINYLCLFNYCYCLILCVDKCFAKCVAKQMEMQI